MIEINRSENKDNWSQIKNLNEPFSTCNVTACINAAQSCGYDVMSLRKSSDPNKRPSDDLYEFIKNDADVQNFYKKVKSSYPPNQIMSVLSYALGKWLGNADKVKWTPYAHINVIGEHIIKNGCAIVHGKYPAKKSDIDHINAIVGCQYGIIYDGLGKISRYDFISFIIDDSYGDYRTKYESRYGNDIIMPMADVEKYLKDVNAPLLKDAILIYV